MPEAVKISELPPLTTVNPNDIVPVVDEFLTQTGKAKASDIAKIGGGPPGNNTVITAHLQNGAVTAPKVGFSAANKIIAAPLVGAGNGREIDCSPYSQGLLAAVDSAAALAHLNGLQSSNNPTFTGQVKVANGTAALPAIVPSSDPATGIFFVQPDSISFAGAGDESFRFQQDGMMLTRSPDEPTVLRARQGALAWCQFNGTAADGQIVTLAKAQSPIAARYGLSIPGAPSALLGVGGSDATSQARAAATIARIKTIETSRGYTLTLEDEGETTPGASWFSDKYGKLNQTISPVANSWPAYARGTEDRANFYSPGDDTLWYWDTATSTWLRTAATGKGWIGSMTLTSSGAAPSLIQDGMGVASVTKTQTGEFAVTFERAFPVGDTKYCVIVTSNDQAAGGTGLVPRIGSLTNTGFNIFFHARGTGTLTNPSVACFAVWR